MQLKNARTLTSSMLSILGGLALAACGFKAANSGDASPGGGSDASMSSSPDASSSSPDASPPRPDASTGNGQTLPVIDSLTAVPTTLIHAGTTITATAHDTTAGVTITSVKLTDTATGVVYGAFTAGSGGSFTFSLTWAELESAASINFAANATVTRVVTANVVDSENNSASAMLTLTLGCPAGQAAQAGVCDDLDTDINNCGSFGNKCESSDVCKATLDLSCACIAANCTSEIPKIVDAATTCDSVCQDHGATCQPNVCTDLPMGAVLVTSLTTTKAIACNSPSPTKPTAVQEIDCCCVQ